MKKLSEEEQRLRNAGLTVVKVLADEYTVYSASPETINAINVPDDVEPEIYKHLKGLPAHEVYGSVPAKAQSPVARNPSDIDMVVPDPKSTAHTIKQLLGSRGYKTNVKSNPSFGSYVVQVEKNGEFVDAADIHPLEGHYGTYDVHGESLAPMKVNDIYVQRAADQLMRKGNSVLGFNKKDGKWGPANHRELKDTVDFVTNARTLLDSKKLQVLAELKQVEKAEKALKIWEGRAKQIKGFDPKEHPVGKDPIPDKYEKKFISHAQNNPDVAVNSIVIGPRGKITVTKRKDNTGRRANPLYTTESRHANSLYATETKRASSPYDDEPEAYGFKGYNNQSIYKGMHKSSPTTFESIGNALLNEDGRSDFVKLGETNFFKSNKVTDLYKKDKKDKKATTKITTIARGSGWRNLRKDPLF